MGQRIEDRRSQFGMARRRGAGEPDIVAHLDAQIRALMPAGFGRNARRR